MRWLPLAAAALLCACATPSDPNKPNIRRSMQLISAKQIDKCSADEITVDLTPLIVASLRSRSRADRGRRGHGPKQGQQEWTALCRGERYRCWSAADGAKGACRKMP